MKRVIVVADDLTGAAEIGGIASRCGLKTQLRRFPLGGLAEAPITVIDTDSRHLVADEAARRARKSIAGVESLECDLIYKKTDSILRGRVRAELEAIMSALGRRAALLVPQNPSRGRTVYGGEYGVDGVPLHLSEFSKDPIHPALTSNVVRLLGEPGLHACRSLQVGEVVPTDGITIGDAMTAGDMRQWAKQVHRGMLAAGGADFFEAILEQLGLACRAQGMVQERHSVAGGRLIVCGSTSASSRALVERARVASVPVCPMPDNLFYGVEEHRASVEQWSAEIVTALIQIRRALVVIRQPVDPQPGASARLEAVLAQVVAQVLSGVSATALFVEGGATASAVCRRMGWSDFAVEGEIARGIVQLRVASDPQQSLAVKPGSYTWPDSVLQ